MIKIRLQRHGARHAPFYRMVVALSQARRDGRFIEVLGTYNPRAHKRDEELKLKIDRIDHWLGVGAQPTDTAKSLIRQGRMSPEEWLDRAEKISKPNYSVRVDQKPLLLWKRVRGTIKLRQKKNRRSKAEEGRKPAEDRRKAKEAPAEEAKPAAAEPKAEEKTAEEAKAEEAPAEANAEEAPAEEAKPVEEEAKKEEEPAAAEPKAAEKGDDSAEDEEKRIRNFSRTLRYVFFENR